MVRNKNHYGFINKRKSSFCSLDVIGNRSELLQFNNGWTAQWRGRRGWRSPAPSWADERTNEPNRLLFSNSKSVKQSASILDESRDGRRRHGAELRAPLALTVPELVAALAGCLVGRLALNEKEIIAAGQMKGRGTVVNPLMVVRGARRSCPPARLPTGLSATPILNKLVTFKGRNSPTRSITQRRERDMPSHAHVHVVSLIFKTS